MKNAARRQRRSPRRAVLIRFVRDVADQPADEDVVAGTANRRYSVSGGKGDHQSRGPKDEAKAISERTKAALASAKARGILWDWLGVLEADHLYNCDSGGVRIGIFT